MIDNSFRKNYLLLNYTGNGYYYFVLKFETILGVVCFWFGAAQDCYNLCSDSKNEKFEEFTRS